MLQRETPEFIPPEMWPPNSPDFNPVDYSVWGMLQQKVYCSRIHDVKELKDDAADDDDDVCWGSGGCWTMHNVVAAAIAQWHTGSRLNACVRVIGGHFEYTFWASDFLLCFDCFIDTGFRKCDRYKHVQSANVGVKCVACPSVRPFDTRQFIYSFIKAPLATARAHLRIGSVRLFDVCLSVVKMRTQKRDFLKK